MIAFGTETPLTLTEAADLTREPYGSIDPRTVSRLSYHNKSDTLCILRVHEDTKTITIAFRGTYSLRNWFVNFSLFSHHGVHRGIAHAVDYHYPVIAEFLKDMPGYTLIVLGHSLGGSMAVEFAYRLYERGYRDVWVYGFGSVRCHLKKKAKTIRDAIGANVFLFANNNDLVPRLLGVSYDHVVPLIHFDRHGDLHWEISWWGRFVDRFKGQFERPILDLFSDHSMGDYQRLASAWERDYAPSV